MDIKSKFNLNYFKCGNCEKEISIFQTFCTACLKKPIYKCNSCDNKVYFKQKWCKTCRTNYYYKQKKDEYIIKNIVYEDTDTYEGYTIILSNNKIIKFHIENNGECCTYWKFKIDRFYKLIDSTLFYVKYEINDDEIIIKLYLSSGNKKIIIYKLRQDKCENHITYKIKLQLIDKNIELQI